MAEQHRILIADDEPILTKLLDKIFRLEGYATRLVNHSAEVIEQLRQFNPHAVVLDIAMPGLSGHEVARQIRTEPGFENVLIVAVSGYGDSHAKSSLQAGIDHHLVKPVDFKQLSGIISCRLASRDPPADSTGDLAGS